MTTNSQPTYATAAALAGVAREVEQVRRELAELRELPGRVDELARLVAQLAETSAAARTGEPEQGPPAWLSLPPDLHRAGGGQAEQNTVMLLTSLTVWLGRVYLRYADAARSLPVCWLWHPEVVEELLWLQAAWYAAYTAEGASVTAAGDWHDRLRPGVVRRIRDYAGLCSIENHQPSPPARRVPLASAAGPIAAWWAARRDEPMPEPTAEQVSEADTQPRARPGSRGAR